MEGPMTHRAIAGGRAFPARPSSSMARISHDARARRSHASRDPGRGTEPMQTGTLRLPVLPAGGRHSRPSARTANGIATRPLPNRYIRVASLATRGLPLPPMWIDDRSHRCVVRSKPHIEVARSASALLARCAVPITVAPSIIDATGKSREKEETTKKSRCDLGCQVVFSIHLRLPHPSP